MESQPQNPEFKNNPETFIREDIYEGQSKITEPYLITF